MAFAQTIEFRFKVPPISPTTPPNQSLLVNRTGSVNASTQFGVYLEYTGSLTSGSYSGSIVDPYFQYGTLKFIHAEAGVSASVYLPFFNGDWWSVMVTRKDDPYVTYDLYTVNKTLNEYDEYTIQYSGSDTVQTLFNWNKPGQTLIPGSGSSTIAGKTYVSATGSFQEVRYYKVPLSASQFTDFGANSNSIESNTITSSYEDLFFRASLGGELFTGSTSIHPAVNTTPSFDSGNSNFTYTGSYTFTSNVETHFYDQMLAGIKNPVSKKIQQESTILPYSGSNETNVPTNQTLSPYRSIQQTVAVSESYTKDIDYVEVAFSPQNEINDDINDQLGYFNVGEYIGDPRLVSSSATSYPALDDLRNYYFQKYSNNYNWTDYIRLIKFFDNSLFKMIKDWVPARTSLATGIVVKQNLLERNKYPVPQFTTPQDQTIVGNIESGNIVGDNALGLQTSQSWSETIPTVFGPTVVVNSDQSEFYTGIFSGSTVEVTNGTLASPSESVLINNAIENRRNSKYMEIDFTTNQTVAVNQNNILSGSATKASIPDSNYTTARIVNPRYKGVKNNETNQYVNHFALFDWIGGSDPQYPGGGNVHIINLIDINGNITTLTPENKNLFTVSNIFKKGDTVYGYQTNATSTPTSLPPMTIVEGGALYETILLKSGSGDISGANFIISGDSVNETFTNFSFVSGSNVTSSTIFSDTTNFLSPLLNVDNYVSSLFTYKINSFTVPTSIGGNPLYIFDKKKNRLISNTSESIPTENTYFPIQSGDFIRFGDSNLLPTQTASLDFSWNNKNLYQIISTFDRGNLTLLTSSLQVTPVAHSYPQSTTNQAFRLIRRIPNETFVLIQDKPLYTSRGLLIPQNFNPNYDPVEIAQKIGLV
jgi:hypothetical protein